MKIKKIPLLKLIRERYPEYDKKELFSMILSGRVHVEQEPIRDPKVMVSQSSYVILDRAKRYVSRGGEKLDHALQTWNIGVHGKIFVDCGASTGGFTDCLLEYGATTIFAVDVGYNQLAYKLRIDSRVVVHEKTNIMECAPDFFVPTPDAAVCDLSFRSIKRAGSHILGLVKPEGFCIALVKPQFEWETPEIDFRGVVPDPKVGSIVLPLVAELGLEGVSVKNVVVSPIRGRDGNMELFFMLVRDPKPDTHAASTLVRRALGMDS